MISYDFPMFSDVSHDFFYDFPMIFHDFPMVFLISKLPLMGIPSDVASEKVATDDGGARPCASTREGGGAAVSNGTSKALITGIYTHMLHVWYIYLHLGMEI